MSDNYWKERFYSLKRWVEQQPNISEASEKDWEDFWYDSESEGREIVKEESKVFSYNGWIPAKKFGLRKRR